VTGGILSATSLPRIRAGVLPGLFGLIGLGTMGYNSYKIYQLYKGKNSVLSCVFVHFSVLDGWELWWK